MSKRYVASHRIAWGKRHLNAGEELVDPSPSENDVLLTKVLLPTKQVREMTAAEIAPPVSRGTYGRRDLTAESRTERPTRARRVAADTDSEPPKSVGAMTTKNTLKKPE